MKKIYSETTIPKASVFRMKHCYVELYINPANPAPGIKNVPTPGVNSFHSLQWGKHKNNQPTMGKTLKQSSSLKPQGPELSYFVCSVV